MTRTCELAPPRTRTGHRISGTPASRRLARRRPACVAYDIAVTANARNDRAFDDVKEVIEAAWAAEIQRRAAEARENPDDDEDWRIALDDIQSL